ncbi:MAG: Methyl-accepting chemotaxis protein 4 [Spirochaetes bacterium ADurb.Bin133]|nr:MAG: Methyl-accepting chemotaxis protein 4 [Spirochaetes bacterium ADurb.Bin133]
MGFYFKFLLSMHILSLFFVVFSLFFFKGLHYKKIVIFISVIFNLAVFSKFFVKPLGTLSIVFDVAALISYLAICLYILIVYSQRFKKVVEAFSALAEGKTDVVLSVKYSDDFKKLSRLYLQLNMNFSALISNVERFSGELIEKMARLYVESAKVKDGIDQQRGVSENLDTALGMQGESIEIGARGLDDTRTMFSKTKENFTVLFNNISSLFEQNQSILRESKNMESYSKTAKNITQNLEDTTKDGIEKIDKIVTFMEGLDKSVNSIKNSVTIIKKIAAQTNLLAMNASIEAAHAGEYGLGFAVVADEIRELSESSAEATQIIKKTVDAIFEEMKSGKMYSEIAKDGVSQIKEAIHNTIEVIDSVSDSINQQTKSVVDTKDIIEQIHELSKEIKGSTEYQQVRTQEIYEATENLNSQAIIINSLISAQKYSLNELLAMIDDLYKVIDDTNTYAAYLTVIADKFKKSAYTSKKA